jgi:hypothetical protein
MVAVTDADHVPGRYRRMQKSNHFLNRMEAGQIVLAKRCGNRGGHKHVSQFTSADLLQELSVIRRKRNTD